MGGRASAVIVLLWDIGGIVRMELEWSNLFDTPRLA